MVFPTVGLQRQQSIRPCEVEHSNLALFVEDG
jgi:hypothetical protein